jgi:hypothetical protein
MPDPKAISLIGQAFRLCRDNGILILAVESTAQ